jgi:hypothetical protein
MRRTPTLLKSLGMLGTGACKRIVRVPTDAQGRMRADALPQIDAVRPSSACRRAT